METRLEKEGEVGRAGLWVKLELEDCMRGMWWGAGRTGLGAGLEGAGLGPPGQAGPLGGWLEGWVRRILRD